MSNSLLIAKKIDVARDWGGVVRSMKALAASSLGQYQRALDSLDGYVAAVNVGLGACLRRSVSPQPHAAQNNSDHAAIVIVFGSDQGLVRSFNENLEALIDSTLAEVARTKAVLWAVGERMAALMRSKGALQVKEIAAAGSIDAVGPLVDQLLSSIASTRDKDAGLSVRILHHHPARGAGYQPVLTRLLPFVQRWYAAACALPWPGNQTTEMIDGDSKVLAVLIDAYLYLMLSPSCVESLVSENASRLAAMQRAEKNISALLDEMERRFHRVKQETIDEELFDVIAGFDAAKSDARRREMSPDRLPMPSVAGVIFADV